jgi:hypothetical protein
MGRWAWPRPRAGESRQDRASPGGYLAAIDSDPVLIVPNRTDVDRIERTCCGAPRPARRSIGTFDDVFRELALGATDARAVTSDAQRAFVAGASSLERR